MEKKKDVQVIINDKVLTLTGDESAEYMQKVALYINNKMNECKMSDQYHKLPADYQNLLLSLNIADDYFKAKDKIDTMQSHIDKLEKQLYDIQHEQIEIKIKYESSQKLLEDYKTQLSELQKKLMQKQSDTAAATKVITSQPATTASAANNVTNKPVTNAAPAQRVPVRTVTNAPVANKPAGTSTIPTSKNPPLL